MDDADRTLDAIERLGALVRAEHRRLAAAEGLQPVHLEVLRYLARCNRYSNTPAALTEFLASTKGTVSQSIKLLAGRGLIAKLADSRDRRVVRLKLTAKGTRLLATVEAGNALRAAVLELDRGPLKKTGDAVLDILRAAQRHNAQKAFGLCRQCRYFRRPGPGEFRCGLTGEPLSVADSGKICVEFEAADGA